MSKEMTSVLKGLKLIYQAQSLILFILVALGCAGAMPKPLSKDHQILWLDLYDIKFCFKWLHSKTYTAFFLSRGIGQTCLPKESAEKSLGKARYSKS